MSILKKVVEFEGIKSSTYSPYDQYRKDCPPDKALVAYDREADELVVLCWIGPGLDYWINECGAELDTVPLSSGFWIWTGTVQTYRDYWGEYDVYLEGGYEKPTKEDLDLYRGGEDPWDPTDWTLPPDDCAHDFTVYAHQVCDKCGKYEALGQIDHEVYENWANNKTEHTKNERMEQENVS